MREVVLSIAEASRRLGVSPARLTRYLDRGAVPKRRRTDGWGNSPFGVAESDLERLRQIMESELPPGFVTQAAAAEYLGISPIYLYALRRKGILKSWKSPYNGAIGVSLDSIAAYDAWRRNRLGTRKVPARWDAGKKLQT